MAVNEAGVFATLLNGRQTLGPEAGKRSRGELPLDALDFEAAADAAEALKALEASAYRPFNLLICDSEHAFLLHNDGTVLRETRLDPGRYLLSHSDLNDASDPRFQAYGDATMALPLPQSPKNLQSWAPWSDVLESRAPDAPFVGLTIETDFGFATVSRALFALEATGKAVWWHADHKDAPFHKVLG